MQPAAVPAAVVSHSHLLDLQAAMRALGFTIKKADVKKRLAAVDKNNTGCISQEQFQQLMTEVMLEKNPADITAGAFRLFDTQSIGKISAQNLKVIANELGQQVDDQDLLGMIEEFDLDRDGYINTEEFQRIMNMAEA